MRTKHLVLFALLPLPALGAVFALSLGAGCDLTNPDDFDAGPDAPLPSFGVDASDAGDGGGPSGFDSSFDAFNPFVCDPPCKATEFCYGSIFLVAKDPLDGGDDAGDGDAAPPDAAFDAAAPFAFECRALPPACASDPSCICVSDAAAPGCPGSIFCTGDAGLVVTCAQGGP